MNGYWHTAYYFSQSRGSTCDVRLFVLHWLPFGIPCILKVVDGRVSVNEN